MDKQAIVRAKRSQWMNSKLAEEMVQKETAVSHLPSDRPNTSTHSNTTPPPVAADEVLQKITQKLTHHIREEIMREQLNSTLQEPALCNTLLSRIDDFVSSELTSFTCTICYELMRPPQHLPILLFPCGHTFCEQCINNHITACANKIKSTAKTCPYCRWVIILHRPTPI
jgi:hypothetical protein